MGADETSPMHELIARVRALTEVVERSRFAGATARIDVPDGSSTDEIAARTLAAERLGVPLVIGTNTHRLHEQRAWDALWSAQAALGRWSFGQAESQLDRATAHADDPTLQQRLAFWKQATTLTRRLIRTHPDERLRGDPASPAYAVLDTADQLPDMERAHYRAEIAQLVAVHGTARDDPASVERALWYVIRARLALPGDDPLNGLAWCIRISREFAGRLPADEYLTNLLAQSRQYALLAIHELDDEAAAAARTATEKLQAWDVYRALVAHLGGAFGVDLQRETARFTIAPYHDVDD